MTPLGTGYVGIGSGSPSALLSVGSTNQFQVNSSGAIAAATGVTSSGNVTFSALNTAGIVTNTAAGLPIRLPPFRLPTAAPTCLPTRPALLLYAATTSSIGQLTSTTANQMLMSGGTGTAPAWSTTTYPGTAALGSVLAANTANTITAVTSSTGLTVLQNSGGTITWASTTGTGSVVFSTLRL